MEAPVMLFPGSFDPFTLGHKSLVDRALPLCSRLIITVCHNASKAGRTPVADRVEAIRRLYADEPRVSVAEWDGLTVDLCARTGASWILRGVRSVADFEYERAMADINRRIAGIETLVLFTLPEYGAVSSSVVRELASYGHDVKEFLP